MYFDIKPKTKSVDLFGESFQLNLLKKYLLDESVRMIIIKGLRRTGKTSLLNVALSEINIKSVKIDVRESPFYDKKEFLIFLINKIREHVKGIWSKIIKNIEGVKLGFENFSFGLFFRKDEKIASFFKNLDIQLGKNKESLILAFDEAQLLKDINFDYFLASIFDNYKNIRILLTGSEIGLFDKLLGKTDYNAPLYGRAYLEIETKKMDKEEVAKFLEIGAKQIGKKIKFEEIREVIENLDGIIGWITYYGWFRHQGYSHNNALEKVKIEGNLIIKKEFENFLEGRKARIKYMKVIRYLGKGHNNWASLMQTFRKDGLKISESQLNLYLKELIDFGFIEKIGGEYFVTDPLLDSI